MNRPEVERLFLSVANPQASLYSSIRLISTDGQERIIVSEGKRIRNYRSVLKHVQHVRHNDSEEKMATLFSRLSKVKPGSILFEGPIAYENEAFSFLIGISKREPDIGGFGGAVVAEVNLADYLTYLSNFQIFEKSMTWVFDKAGNRILMPPLREVEVDPEPYLFSEEPIPKGLLLYASGLGHKSTDEQTIVDVSNLFRIAFVMSPRQFSSQMRGAGLITVLVVFATVLFATVIAFLAAKQLSSPIRALSEMTTSVARGDLEARFPEAWSGELGQLAIAFNHMVRTLRETTFSKSYVDNIIQSMTDTLVVMDERGKMVKANRALLDLLGYEERELQGEPVRKLLNDVSVEQEIVQALDKDRFIRGMETVYLAKDGTEIPVSLSSSAMRASDGRLPGSSVWLRTSPSAGSWRPSCTKHRNWSLSANLRQVSPMKLTRRHSLSVITPAFLSTCSVICILVSENQPSSSKPPRIKHSLRKSSRKQERRWKRLIWIISAKKSLVRFKTRWRGLSVSQRSYER